MGTALSQLGGRLLGVFEQEDVVLGFPEKLITGKHAVTSDLCPALLTLDTDSFLRFVQRVTPSNVQVVTKNIGPGILEISWAPDDEHGFRKVCYVGRNELTRYWNDKRSYSAMCYTARKFNQRVHIVHHNLNLANVQLIYDDTPSKHIMALRAWGDLPAMESGTEHRKQNRCALFVDFEPGRLSLRYDDKICSEDDESGTYVGTMKTEIETERRGLLQSMGELLRYVSIDDLRWNALSAAVNWTTFLDCDVLRFEWLDTNSQYVFRRQGSCPQLNVIDVRPLPDGCVSVTYRRRTRDDIRQSVYSWVKSNLHDLDHLCLLAPDVERQLDNHGQLLAQTYARGFFLDIHGYLSDQAVDTRFVELYAPGVGRLVAHKSQVTMLQSWQSWFRDLFRCDRRNKSRVLPWSFRSKVKRPSCEYHYTYTTTRTQSCTPDGLGQLNYPILNLLLNKHQELTPALRSELIEAAAVRPLAISAHVWQRCHVSVAQGNINFMNDTLEENCTVLAPVELQPRRQKNNKNRNVFQATTVAGDKIQIMIPRCGLDSNIKIRVNGVVWHRFHLSSANGEVVSGEFRPNGNCLILQLLPETGMPVCHLGLSGDTSTDDEIVRAACTKSLQLFAEIQTTMTHGTDGALFANEARTILNYLESLEFYPGHRLLGNLPPFQYNLAAPMQTNYPYVFNLYATNPEDRVKSTCLDDSIFLESASSSRWWEAAGEVVAPWHPLHDRVCDIIRGEHTPSYRYLSDATSNAAAEEEEELKADQWIDHRNNVFDELQYDHYNLTAVDGSVHFEVTECLEGDVWKQNYRIRECGAGASPSSSSTSSSSPSSSSNSSSNSSGGSMNRLSTRNGALILQANLGADGRLTVKTGDKRQQSTVPIAIYKAAYYIDKQNSPQPCMVKLGVAPKARVYTDDCMDKVSADDVQVEWIRPVELFNPRPGETNVVFKYDSSDVVCFICQDSVADTCGKVDPSHPSVCQHRMCHSCACRILRDQEKTMHRCPICRAPWIGLHMIDVSKATLLDNGFLEEAYSIYFNRGFVYRLGAHLRGHRSGEESTTSATSNRPVNETGSSTSSSSSSSSAVTSASVKPTVCGSERYHGCLRYDDVELLTYFGLLRDPDFVVPNRPMSTVSSEQSVTVIASRPNANCQVHESCLGSAASPQPSSIILSVEQQTSSHLLTLSPEAPVVSSLIYTKTETSEDAQAIEPRDLQVHTDVSVKSHITDNKDAPDCEMTHLGTIHHAVSVDHGEASASDHDDDETPLLGGLRKRILNPSDCVQ